MSRTYAAIFDMDGVLVDTYRPHYQSWVEMAESAGLPFTEADFAKAFGRTSRETIAQVWGENRFNDAQIRELDERKEMAFRRILDVEFPEMPGVNELLQSLHDAGFLLAVGSSAPPANVEVVLRRLPASGLFRAVVNGRDVQRGKPDPQVYLLAAERLGTLPQRCVVIEDAPVGVAAATAAGMGSVGLLSTDRRSADLSAASATVASLEEITPTILQAIIDRRETTPKTPTT